MNSCSEISYSNFNFRYRKAIILLLFSGVMNLHSQVNINAEINWEQGALTMEISSPLPPSDAPFPLVKHRTQQEILRNFPNYLRGALLPIIIDSFHSFEDAVREKPGMIHTIESLAENAILKRTKMNRDLTSLSLEYIIPLYPGLISRFIIQAPPEPLPGFLTYEPSASFTGIVLYASEPLPVYGERDDQGMEKIENITPCLLPRIFDEDGNEVFSMRNMDVTFLRKWGVAAYIESTDLSNFRDRIGYYPYYATARGLFGKHCTDLVLSKEDIRRFLTRRENHDLLTEGRIIIIH